MYEAARTVSSDHNVSLYKQSARLPCVCFVKDAHVVQLVCIVLDQDSCGRWARLTHNLEARHCANCMQHTLKRQSAWPDLISSTKKQVTATTRPTLPIEVASTSRCSCRGVLGASVMTRDIVLPYSVLTPTATTKMDPDPSVSCMPVRLIPLSQCSHMVYRKVCHMMTS